MPAERLRTQEEIVARLGGGDRTDGSCASLALAYVGNRAGYDVLDFRGGESCAFFSSRETFRRIAGLPGIRSSIVKGKNDIVCANKLLQTLVPGKEYCLATGGHAAIVRKNGEGFEYLELQHPSGGNGWHELNDKRLAERFGCFSEHTCDFTNFLMDVDSMLSCAELPELLGYLNTNAGAQMKGVSGHVK